MGEAVYAQLVALRGEWVALWGERVALWGNGVALWGHGVALGGQLLLAPGAVAVGNQPGRSFLAGVLGVPDLLGGGGFHGPFGCLLVEHFKEVVPDDALLLAVGQSLLQKVRSPKGEGVALEYVGDRNGLDALEQLVLIPGLPGGVAEHHLVEYDPQRPNIAFCGVLHPFQNLRGHVYGTPYAGFQHLRAEVVHVLGEPEVTDFVDSLVYEDVRRFEVAVDYLLPDQLAEPA